MKWSRSGFEQCLDEILLGNVVPSALCSTKKERQDVNIKHFTLSEIIGPSCFVLLVFLQGSFSRVHSILPGDSKERNFWIQIMYSVAVLQLLSWLERNGKKNKYIFGESQLNVTSNSGSNTYFCRLTVGSSCAPLEQIDTCKRSPDPIASLATEAFPFTTVGFDPTTRKPGDWHNLGR